MTTRFFLCNVEIYGGIYNEILEAKNSFAIKKQHTSFWTCGNMINIEVGDIAYFTRVADSKRGVFASGKVIEPPHDGGIRYRWLALVDFDNPLLFSSLQHRPQFDGANFGLRGSGYQFDDKYTKDLNIFWQQHVDNFGVRG